MNWIKMNRRMIQVLNSCKYDEFEPLIDEILGLPNWDTYFTSRWYIWNIIRPRDFYKMCAMYVHNHTEGDLTEFDKVENLINIVLETAKSEQIKKTFVWNITKSTPLIMWKMIPYMSKEKIINMITKNKKYVITDDLIQPFFEGVNIIRNGEKEDNENE